ncbi:MAG: FG-GAP-like repeat-containing protein [Micrococcales bacterium]|nr:FG-GAP-like repeat-containing protein [Micrococcales bacterium]
MIRKNKMALLASAVMSSCLVLGLPAVATAAPGDYNPSDIAIINGLIVTNGLDWTPASSDGSAIPGDWQVDWSVDATDKRVRRLFLLSQTPPMVGTVDLRGLTELIELSVSDEGVSGLNIAGLNKLEELHCSDTGLQTLDVSGNPALAQLQCSRNLSLTTLILGTHPALTQINVLNDPLLTGTIDASGCPLLNILQIGNTVAVPSFPLGSPISRLILYGGYDMNFGSSPTAGGTVRVASNGVFGSTPIILLAQASSDYTFVGWSSQNFISNAPNGTVSPVQFYRYNVPASSSTVTANFQPFDSVALSQSGTLDFGTATTPYSPITPQSVTVTNTGYNSTGPLDVTLSGTNPSAFTLSTNAIGDLSTGASGAFTVKPNSGLPAGSYSATVTVSSPQGISETFTLVFVVAAAPVASFRLVVRAGAGGSITAGTNGNYPAGTKISLSARANQGYSFSGWTTSGGGVFGNKSSPKTTFTMPSGAVTVTASFARDPVPPSPKPAAVKQMVQIALSPSQAGRQYGDVLAVDQQGTLWRYPSSQTGALAKRSQIGTGWKDLALYAPGDWDKDGHNDIIAVDQATGKMYLYPGKGDGSIGPRRQIGQGWGGYRVIPAGDLTKDGNVDLLAIKESTGDLYLYAGTGTGAFKYPYPKVGYGWKGYELYAASDINNDTKADILSIDRAGDLYFYAGKGDGTFAKKIKVGHGWKGYDLAAGGDLNGDSMADIVSRYSDGSLFFYAATGGGAFAKRVLIGTGW